MQPFSEQPTNRPFYPPAEIYVPEQPQGYVPQGPVYTPPDQQPATGQEIAVYYKRTLLVTYTRLCKVLLVLLAVLLPLSLIAGFASGPFTASDILPLVSIVVILLAAISLLAWWIKVISSLSGPARKPVLHITHAGITIQNAIMVKYRFIRWEEVKTMYAHSTFLKIRSAAPLASLENGQGLSQKRAYKTTRISLMYLDTPAQEILQRLVQTYANELSQYNIQFQP